MSDLSAYKAPAHPKGLILEGQRVTLVPLDAEKHSASLFDSNQKAGGRENWTYLPYGPFDRLPDYKNWLISMQSLSDPCFFTIIRHTDGKAVGIASYLRIKPNDGSIEVGHIHFSPLLQRTTEATEAMFLMMKWAFEAGYRRYEWKCNAKNASSRKAAQRLGLSYEGIFRQATISKNQNRDTAWFAAIDSEWPALRDAFTTYLSTQNFDDEAKPVLSLTKMTQPLLYKTDPKEGLTTF